MNKQRIQQALSAVRTRQRWQCIFGGATAGLLVSGTICLILGLLRFVLGEFISITVLTVVAAGGPILGGMVAGLPNLPWKSAAAAVDLHYGLKDRTVTAWEFSGHSILTGLQELQIADAADHLKMVDPRSVVPFRLPWPLGWSLLSVIAAGVALVWPLRSSEVIAKAPQPIGIVLAADEIEDDLEELEEIAEEVGNEELTELVEELKAKLEELREPETDVRKALATISEMQAELQAQRAEYNVEAMEAQLNALGAAMETAAAFEAAAAALQDGDFDKAATALEQVDPKDLNRAEAKATSEQLAEAAKAMEKSGMQSLSETVSELSEGVKTNDSESMRESSSKLAKEVRKQAISQKLSQLLSSQCDKLGESKSLCRKPGTSLAQRENRQESDSPSEKAGATTAGNIKSDPTLLQGQTQMAELTGQLSESGDSEFETTTSPEGSEQAERQAREAFAKYEKLSEAVLNSEPIPLGHRETIRRYFESIRPAGADAAAISESDAPPRSE